MGCRSSTPETPRMDWMCEIDEDYLASSVSTYGLSEHFTHFKKCMRYIRGERDIFNEYPVEEQNQMMSQIRVIYGLLHARYLCTEEGVEAMYEKYQKGIYGGCPRACCQREFLLPIGLSDQLNYSNVKLFCPRCFDIYESFYQIDGAFFGTTFPLYFMKYHNIHPKKYVSMNFARTGHRKVDRRLRRWRDILYKNIPPAIEAPKEEGKECPEEAVKGE